MHDILSQAREALGPSIGVETFIEGMRHQDRVDPYGTRNPLHTTTVPILHPRASARMAAS
ncbi:hypothetical protein [Streptomyces acidiscabies]|uniref:Uncharacterized protein n=1 Tax=Streptomyces acidiscabies TaxID=42234 RepID=A0A0L0JC86_9ACTN|nr:hypothetical protein [Streptomyces acidiscabies]KND23281.1 hypothetical protein IQ63_45240 [Streptomyces acidiscabies]